MRDVERIRVLNSSVDVLSFQTALDAACALAKDHTTTSYIVAVNPEKVMIAQRDSFIAEFLERADLLIPDGIGVVVAAKWLLNRTLERVPGADLAEALFRVSGERELNLFLFGASENVNAETERVMRARYPDVRIVGRQNGYLPESDYDTLVARINASNADALLLALGSPKQERWTATYGARLDVGVCMGVGGAFDTFAGAVKRAPVVWQTMRLEWLYRLVRQPKRFWRQRRIFIFAARVLMKKLILTLTCRRREE